MEMQAVSAALSASEEPEEPEASPMIFETLVVPHPQAVFLLETVNYRAELLWAPVGRHLAAVNKDPEVQVQAEVAPQAASQAAVG